MRKDNDVVNEWEIIMKKLKNSNYFIDKLINELFFPSSSLLFFVFHQFEIRFHSFLNFLLLKSRET